MADEPHTPKITREPEHPGCETLGDADHWGEDFYLLVDGERIGGSYWCSAEYVKDGERWASWGPAGLSMGHRTREDAERVQVTARLDSDAKGSYRAKGPFRLLAQEITREMGAGWVLSDPGYVNGSLRLNHKDGRSISLYYSSDPERVTATGRFPETDIRVKHVETSAAVSRGAAAIARQINGKRFMGVYGPAFAHVRDHNATMERREKARAQVREFLKQYIPEEEMDRFSARRPSITTRQAYEKADNTRSGYDFTDRVVVDLEFRELTPEEARMIMRAFSISIGHTPEFLRPAA